MEAKGSLARRVVRLEGIVPGDVCRTCAARPVFTIGNGAPLEPCRECGRTTAAFTIDIDRTAGREGDAA